MTSPTGQPNGRQRQYVLRDTGSAVVFWVAVAVFGLLLGDNIARGDWATLGFTLPLVLLGAWLLWFVLVHPHVRYDSNRVMVVNIGRVHELPWSRVTAVRQRLGVVFEMDDGSTVTAAGASAPRGMGTIVGGITGKLGENAVHFNRNALSLDAMRASAAPTPAPVVSRWDRIPLLVGAALVVAAIVDLVIAFA